MLFVQAIVTILDSTLNKSGRLKALYVKTEKGVLIEIKPHVRIPRTFKRFCGLMCKCSYLPWRFTLVFPYHKYPMVCLYYLLQVCSSYLHSLLLL